MIVDEQDSPHRWSPSKAGFGSLGALSIHEEGTSEGGIGDFYRKKQAIGAKAGRLHFVPEGLAPAHLSNLTGEAGRPPPIAAFAGEPNGSAASAWKASTTIVTAGASRSVDNDSCNNRRMAEPRELRPSATRTVIVPFYS